MSKRLQILLFLLLCCGDAFCQDNNLSHKTIHVKKNTAVTTTYIVTGNIKHLKSTGTNHTAARSGSVIVVGPDSNSLSPLNGISYLRLTDSISSIIVEPDKIVTSDSSTYLPYLSIMDTKVSAVRIYTFEMLIPLNGQLIRYKSLTNRFTKEMIIALSECSDGAVILFTNIVYLMPIYMQQADNRPLFGFTLYHN
ncbi:MAG TPA: hypothetical protein VK806_13805 [Bacteroidia bacterium]|jgi:hypothetical protein|nr:hypothetical protein [Bacteroidia bacterium]